MASLKLSSKFVGAIPGGLLGGVLYAFVAFFVTINFYYAIFLRWPSYKKDCGFVLAAIVTSLLVGAIWPIFAVLAPINWLLRSLTVPGRSCCGFNYNAWKAKR